MRGCASYQTGCWGLEAFNNLPPLSPRSIFSFLTVACITFETWTSLICFHTMIHVRAGRHQENKKINKKGDPHTQKVSSSSFHEMTRFQAIIIKKRSVLSSALSCKGVKLTYLMRSHSLLLCF